MKTIFITLIVLSSTFSAYAKIDGGSDRGGGDAKLIRSKIFQSKRQDLIKKVTALFEGNSDANLKSILAWMSKEHVRLPDQTQDAILKDMQKRGLGKDIYSTNFKLEKSCVDKNGIEKTATTEMNVMNSSICINVEKFVDDFGPYIQDSDIIGLLMHEYSHHFGYSDEKHEFAAGVTEFYQKDNERRNEEGDPLNYLIK